MSLIDADWEWEAMAERSHALFGSPHRLRVALLVSIADPDELYAARIAEHAGLKRTEAIRQLEGLEKAELLGPGSFVPVRRRPGKPARYLKRHDEQAWE